MTGLLNIVNNLNTLWLVIIIALGLCFITVSVVLLLLERAKRETVEDFSQQDKKMIIGLVEERIDELTAKMDLFREDIENSTQTVFNKITSKVDELKTSHDQTKSLSTDSLTPAISGLTERIDAISQKLEEIKKSLSHSKPSGIVESLSILISNLGDNIEGIAKKMDVLQEEINKIEAKTNLLYPDKKDE
ncbi:MAG: hypothetical protein JW983_07160 [Elusimicrobia bacterium]|nr:hypothetical protein [Elusimicrobiota bacterium]